jgi:hypothetical protein
MLRIRERILLAAFASVFAGVTGGWALLAVLPSKIPARPALGASALTYTADSAGAAAIEMQREAPATATPPVLTPPAPAAVMPERAAAADPAPAGREFRLKLDNGASASLDPESGRVQLRTPFGNLELKL